MLRILHLQTELNITCGVSKIVYLLTKHTADDYENFVISLGGNGTKKFISSNIKLKILKQDRNSIFGTVKIFLFILNYCIENKIQIVHSHHRYFDFIVWIVSKFISLKTISSVHSITYFYKFISYKANLLICNSSFVKLHLIHYYGIKDYKIKLIPNFIDPDDFIIKSEASVLKQKLGIRGKKVIGYVGRIDINCKGIDILLSAFRNIYELRKDVFLLLVGDGKSQEAAFNFIKKTNIDGVILSGKINIYDYINIMDIVVLPSRNESFGLVILESGLMKKIFIGSKSGGIPEVINDNIDGLLFENNNSSDLFSHFQTVLKNLDDFKYLGENLNYKVLKVYSTSEIIPVYLKTYQESMYVI